MKILGALLLFVGSALAQAPALVTVTGTIYNASGAPCAGCTFTISNTRTVSGAINGSAQTITATPAGAISFTAPQGSVATITGPVRGRYDFTGGVQVYFKAQATDDFNNLRSVEDALLGDPPTAQVAGITALTGDVIASGSGSVTATIQPITEAKQSLSDVLAGNATTARHGYLPKLLGDATKYLDSTGNYSVPAGTGTGNSCTAINALTDTWTNSVLLYDGLALDVSDNGSLPNSRLMDLRINGASRLKVQKNGLVGINMGANAPVRPLSVEGTAVIGKGTGTSDHAATLILRMDNNATSYDAGQTNWGTVINTVNGTTPALSLGVKATSGVIAFHQAANNLLFGFQNNGPFTEIARITGDKRFTISTAATANPGTAELASAGAVSMYVKNARLVFAYNLSGVIQYLSIPLDGSSNTFTVSTVAP